MERAVRSTVTRTVTRTVTALLSAALVAAAPWSAPAGATDRDAGAPGPPGAPLSSLPRVDSGERPGPAVLYSAPPRAPQLENADPRFVAPFDRVSGTDRSVDGEYLYTDHLYDDRGAGGALTYPTDRARYGDNAADLVEFRLSTRDRDALAVRFTLNTLLVEDSTLAVAAFDTDGDPATGSATLPSDPGAPFPGTDAVLTAWGTGATWSTWDGSRWSTVPVAARADLLRNQLTAVVPRTVARPAGTWTTTVAVGLRDPGTGGFLLPQQTASADRPGGGADLPAIFNLGFRFDEPVVTSGAEPDEAQGEALDAGAPTRYQRAIDLDALEQGRDSTTVPATGPMVRLFPSRLTLGEGKDLDAFPAFLGQLQSYSVHVPTTYRAGTPTPLTLNLHSLGERHWQYNGTTGTSQLSEERGNLVATPDARGEDGWYQDEAEHDVFEVWNDLAASFTLDPDRAYLAGYSMGGMGTYRLGTLYPDLFARAATTVGPPGDGIWLGAGAPTGGAATLSNLWLENARNLPFLNMVAGADELVPITGTTQQNTGPAYSGRTSFDALGYRYAFDVYPAAEHLTLAVLGYDLPQMRDHLGGAAVDRDPFHVTYAYSPAADNPGLGLVHDKAYWVSGVRLRDPSVGTTVSATAPAVGKGVLDAESHGFGVDDPVSTRSTGSGTVPLPYVEVRRTWGDPPPRPAANRLDLTLTNLASGVVDLPRARLQSARPLVVTTTSDGPATVTLVAEGGRTARLSVPTGPAVTTLTPGDFGGR